MRRRNTAFIVFAAIFLIILASGLFWYVFRLKRIIVVAQRKPQVSYEDLKAANLIFLNSQEVSEQIVSQDRHILSVFVKKQFPSTIIVDVSFRKPYALLRTSDLLYELDCEGVILEEASASSPLVPVVETSQGSFPLTALPDSRVAKALQLNREIAKQSIRIERIRMEPAISAYHIYTNEDEEFIVPYSEDIARLAASLQLTMSRFRIEGKSVRTIDFRFNKPVVTLKNG